MNDPLADKEGKLLRRIAELEDQIEEQDQLMRWCYNPDAMRLRFWNPLMEECYRNWLADLRACAKEGGTP